MMIRNYNIEDLLMMNEWAKKYGDTPFSERQVPTESTFVAYENGEPQLVCSVIKTNTDIAWLDNLIGNPNKNRNKTLLKEFLEYMTFYAINSGKSILFCMSKHPKTTELYKKLGFTNTLKNVDTFYKEIQ